MGRRRPKLPVIIGLAVVLVAALGIGIFMLVRFFLAGGGSPVFYLQEEKLMYQSGAGKDPVPVMEGVSAAAVAATPDGKYAGLLLSDGYQITLCRVELGKLGKDLSKNLNQIQVVSTQLSEDYWSYCTGGEVSPLPTATAEENRLTIFAMGGDGTLYYIDSMQDLCRADASGAEDLGTQAEAFQMSQDGSRILLRQPDDELGLWTQEGVQEVTDEVIEVVYTDPELTQICYTQPGEEIGYDYTYDLYAWEGGNPRLLAERISGDIQMTSPDQFIYVALNPQEYRLSQFVQDDMASQDANITRPTYDDFRTTETYTDFFGNQRERTTTDYDAYREAYDQYREKENRDWLRQHLEDETVQRDTYAIYLRQDGTDTLICDLRLPGAWACAPWRRTAPSM